MIERFMQRIPVVVLCTVAHLTGFGVGFTIGQDFWLYFLFAMTGLICIIIGIHQDNPSNDKVSDPRRA